MFNRYNKVTVGFVTQTFEREGESGPFSCTNQTFIYGDGVSREDEMGDALPPIKIEEARRQEQYQPFDMVQPGHDYYILEIWGLVEPNLYGPFNETDSETVMEKYKNDPANDENTYHLITVPKGAKIEI